MQTQYKPPINLLSQLKQYRSSTALEDYLGNPTNPDHIFSFKNSVQLDEQEVYPEDITNLLEKWGFYYYYIPSAYGGKLESYEEILSLMRVISRRDLTVAIGHGKTYLGSVGVWVGDDEIKKYKLARIIKEGKQVALGLTEKDHGSDINANEVLAEEVEDGYLLTGEKWLINNATRSKAMTIFAKTDQQAGPRNFSVFLIEKEGLDPTSYQHLKKIKTHGIRGADISGIRFNQCLIPKASMVGKPGMGLESTLKGFQITRTLCASLSLGAADTALRSTLAFADSRQLYGDRIFSIPVVQQQLVDAFVDIMICECVAISAARAIHVVPEQMSVWSAVVKYFVPTMAENLIQDLSRILGARYYLRESHWDGIFQKMVRDNAIVSLFDGSTSVNLYAIALSQKHFGKYRKRIEANQSNKLNDILEDIFSLTQDLPDASLEKLSLFNQGYNSTIQSLEISLIKLEKIYHSQEANSEVIEIIIYYASKIRDLIEKLYERFNSVTQLKPYKESPDIFTYAKHYCMLHAATTCLNMWLYNRNDISIFFEKGEWLVLCLQRLMILLLNSEDLLKNEEILNSCKTNLSDELITLYNQNNLFSIIPTQLG
ncbi:MAG: acyl-CoA dehydrogenase [Thermosynechococcaceae cyanobacterium]